jgi:1,2-dihydroxy-3-keto-5-methylthiopentene dioxygenase
MTRLTVYQDTTPFAPSETIAAPDAIAAALAEVGAGFERWPLPSTAKPASDAAILAAHGADIERLNARGGYRSCDVVRLTPDHPDAGAMRAKFLAEHVHDDDEVRFFVEGSGMFYIRAGGRVHALECAACDLVVLPAGLRHWFDTGARPRFTAIRLFTTPEGWAARFTGDAIAGSIPLYEGAE